MRTADDYDSPWKDALTRYLPDFLLMYFPRVWRAIDWSHAPIFLEQELATVSRDARLGGRRVDKLVRVVPRRGREQWMLIHIDVQARHDAGFAERMFTYNHRLHDQYRRSVASLAVLADGSASWRPRQFGYHGLGTRMAFHFPVVKLHDFRPHLALLLRDANPFALVTAAHLLTQQTRGRDVQRYAAKWRLTRLLYERGWDRQRILDLYAVIEWMMRLPDALERQLWDELASMERRTGMRFITSAERFGLEKGLQQGLSQGLSQGLAQGISQGREQGLAQGIEQGLVQGIAQGKAMGERSLLRLQLEQRFGALPQAVLQRIDAAPIGVLQAWARAVLTAPTLDAVLAAG